ncbi:hypothetical protein [Smaragdicoccus niigatensis]|uniref:hypothetical protein n=1 Tax=Smaragdicoccus niigatensis TaxID=359359 RepID=UPI00037F6352|nr:hypothetical protein [Smaragdicoccus niigatensis]
MKASALSLQRTPRQRVFIHIGLPKTGSTYLQDRLWRNRRAALRGGLLYPGETHDAHFQAATHLQPERYLDWANPAYHGILDKLVNEIRHWPRTSILSHELFANASVDRVQELVHKLDFAEVHVIVAARDLARQIPSVWQENIKNQYTTSFEQFVADVASENPATDPFWEFQDVTRILSTWGSVVPADRMHVVTVPSSSAGTGLLWDRFLSVLGIDGSFLPLEIEFSNSSLGVGGLEVLRLVNQRVRGNIDWWRYENVVKNQLIGSVLAHLDDQALPTLPEEAREWAVEKSASIVAHIVDVGFDVVGDLDELQPANAARGCSEMGEREVLAVAVEALVGMINTMPEPEIRWSAKNTAKGMLRAPYTQLAAMRFAFERRFANGSWAS